MLIFVVLNILIITEICHSFTPYFPNEHYIKPELKTSNSRQKSSSKILKSGTLREVNNRNSSYPRNYASRLISDVARKLNNSDHKERESNFKTAQSSPRSPLFNSQLLVERQPYKSGSISDILSSYQTSPVLLINPPGSYQSQLEFENPTTTTAAPPTESVIATSLKTEIYHPSRAVTTLRNSKRLKSAETPNKLTPVRAASLNTEVYHRPQENITDKSDRPLQRPAPIVLYNQTIVHINEPKYLHTPFSPLRKPRNLREFPVDKLIEHKKSDSNETQYESDATAEDEDGGDGNDDSGDAETRTETDGAEAGLSDEQPPLAKHEMRYMHDIFLNYPKTHQANYGHVQLTPQIFEKRFESTKEGNRYKGEVLWMDNKGGYAQHNWNLALGKL